MSCRNVVIAEAGGLRDLHGPIGLLHICAIVGSANLGSDMLRRASILALLVAIPGTATAQDRCLETLIRANPIFNPQDVSDLALVRLIGEATTVRPQPMSDGTIRYNDETLGQNFKEAGLFANSYFRITRFSYNQERLLSVAAQPFSIDTVREFDDCLATGEISAPRILVHDASREAVTITVIWHAPPRGRKKAAGTVQVEGGSLSLPFPTLWRSGVPVSRRVRRQPNKDTGIVAAIGGQTSNAVAAWVPRIRMTGNTLLED